MDNEKSLNGKVTFNCPTCGSSNPIYNIDGFKYIHLIKANVNECGVCGDPVYTDNQMLLDYANN